MAAVKMTFSLPRELARRFLRTVPPRERSKTVAAALEQTLAQRQAELIKSCKLANDDPEVAQIERELDGLKDPIEEPWDDFPSR